MMQKVLTGISRLINDRKQTKDASLASAKNDEDAQDQDAWIEGLVWRNGTDEQNPFDHEVLDCRVVALGFTATTSDKSIAESFNHLRLEDGKSCIGTLPENTFTVESDLKFPYNGVREDGVLFSAREMEDKWDFYAYESRLYIRRSWTGALLHVAELRYRDSEVIIDKIHSDRDTIDEHAEFVIEHVRFLIMSHFGASLLPFPIPPGMPRSERRSIALMGFSRYGRRAQFGRYLGVEVGAICEP